MSLNLTVPLATLRVAFLVLSALLPGAHLFAHKWTPSKVEIVGESGPIQAMPEAMKAFLAARSKDIRAAGREPHRSFLLEMCRRGLGERGTWSEKVWALTRLVEAGDYTHFPEWVKALTDHISGITQPNSDCQGRILSSELKLSPAMEVPVYRLHSESPFWGSLERTVRSTPDLTVSTGLYSVWCYHTRPDQRDLILEVARRVKPQVQTWNRSVDLWNDPRFWIVLDWAIAWGEAEDFAALEAALPEGISRNEFRKRTFRLKSVPGFFGCRLENAKGEGRTATGLILPPGVEAPSDLGDGLERGKSGPALGIQEPKLDRTPPVPFYPEEARGRRLMNQITMNCLIDEQGKPCGFRPQPGPWLAFFAPTAVEWVKDFRFLPGSLNGKAVKGQFTMVLPFKLLQ